MPVEDLENKAYENAKKISNTILNTFIGLYIEDIIAIL